MASLRIELLGQVVPARLPDGPVRIGRDASCELRLDVAGISALHATIEPIPGGGHKLVDANSGVPTKVNGVAAKRVRLNDGDVIEVGPARIAYAVADAVPAPAAASRGAAALATTAPPAPTV